jgi:AraC-like DNA-binding protein
LEGLAGTAGMSRTSFAIRFRDLLGEPVMEYLTRWRMLLAADELRTGRKSIAGVAASVGYESESAFGAAFKRVFGQPPRRFAKARPDEHRVWNS